MRKLISIAILLAAGCGGGTTQTTLPCNPIIKHDTVWRDRPCPPCPPADTIRIDNSTHDTIATHDTITLIQEVTRFNQWRDTMVVDTAGNVLYFLPDSANSPLPNFSRGSTFKDVIFRKPAEQ